MSDLPILDTPNVKAHFDARQGISFITYRGDIEAQYTEQVYDWVRDVVPLIGPDATHGVVFDFRDVTRFAPSDISTAQRESKAINQEYDNTTHPVALIVDTFYQEQVVRVTTKISPQEDRKTIVHSMEEALQFIEEWHAEQEHST